MSGPESIGPDVPPPDDKPGPATEGGRRALDGLRAIWTANGQMGEAQDLGLECADDERG
ncbi:MAG: hypothetical protein QOF96_2136, partial [Actinomycetota bacterium]|nr:hypothetical protein [Actinomycetota bacterium]